MVEQVEATRSPDLRAYFKVRRRLKDEQLVLAKADIGETIVLLSRSQYEDKGFRFLKDAKASLNIILMYELLSKTPVP
mgnify:CR=1 FL=1